MDTGTRASTMILHEFQPPDTGMDSEPESGRVVTFTIASGAAERQEVFALRQHVYQETMPFLLDPSSAEHPAADRFDDVSLLFCARLENRLIASVRFSRPIDGVWEVPELSGMINALPGAVERAQFQGRGVVHDQYRGLGVLAALLHHGCSWVLRHTRSTDYVGICSPQLLPFYLAAGSIMVGVDEIRIASRNGKHYRLLRGDLQTMSECMRRHAENKGWRFFDPGDGGELRALTPRKAHER